MAASALAADSLASHGRLKASSASKLSDFVKLKRLGAGSFGVVYMVRRKADGQVYVLKQLALEGMSDKEQQAAYTEVRLLYEMDSPYVVEYYDSFLDDDRLNIVMEYCDRGDLQQALKRQGGKPVPEETIWGVFIQIALGLHDLHAARILHRDMKSANVFMKSTAEVKIGDLGVARLLGTQSQFAKTCVGTPYYLSPELCQGHAYNAKSDLWALGCVLYEMATLQHPFEASNQGALVLKIVMGTYEPVAETQYSAALRDTVTWLLQKDVDARPDSLQLLASAPVVSAARDLDITLPPAALHMHQSALAKARLAEERVLRAVRQDEAMLRLARPRRSSSSASAARSDSESAKAGGQQPGATAQGKHARVHSALPSIGSGTGSLRLGPTAGQGGVAPAAFTPVVDPLTGAVPPSPLRGSVRRGHMRGGVVVSGTPLVGRGRGGRRQTTTRTSRVRPLSHTAAKAAAKAERAAEQAAQRRAARGRGGGVSQSAQREHGRRRAQPGSQRGQRGGGERRQGGGVGGGVRPLSASKVAYSPPQTPVELEGRWGEAGAVRVLAVAGQGLGGVGAEPGRPRTGRPLPAHAYPEERPHAPPNGQVAVQQASPAQRPPTASGGETTERDAAAATARLASRQGHSPAQPRRVQTGDGVHGASGGMVAPVQAPSAWVDSGGSSESHGKGSGLLEQGEHHAVSEDVLDSSLPSVCSAESKEVDGKEGDSDDDAAGWSLERDGFGQPPHESASAEEVESDAGLDCGADAPIALESPISGEFLPDEGGSPGTIAAAETSDMPPPGASPGLPSERESDAAAAELTAHAESEAVHHAEHRRVKSLEAALQHDHLLAAAGAKLAALEEVVAETRHECELVAAELQAAEEGTQGRQEAEHAVQVLTATAQSHQTRAAWLRGWMQERREAQVKVAQLTDACAAIRPPTPEATSVLARLLHAAQLPEGEAAAQAVGTELLGMEALLGCLTGQQQHLLFKLQFYTSKLKDTTVAWHRQWGK